VLKVKSDLLMNLANVYYWRGCRTGGQFDAEWMRRSVDVSWQALEYATNVGDFQNLAKLGENIAHVEFKLQRALGLGVAELAAFYESNIVKRRERSLLLWAFLQDARGTWHGVKNQAWELCVLGRLEDARLLVKEALRLAELTSSAFTRAASVELRGDLNAAEGSIPSAVESYSEAAKAYRAAGLAQFYADNVAAKAERLNADKPRPTLLGERDDASPPNA
jgi:hypothetical protein